MKVLKKMMDELEALADSTLTPASRDVRKGFPPATGNRPQATGFSGADSFAQLLSAARERVSRGEQRPEIPITRQMLDDTVNGEFWRQLKNARERVRKLGT